MAAPAPAVAVAAAEPGGQQGQALMRDLVRALVRSELRADAVPGMASAASRAFFQVFQRLSSAPGPRGDPASAEGAVSDLIAAQLLRQRRSEGQGVDGHLRFNGLRRRMQAQPLLCDDRLRRSALELLYALRGGDEEDRGADAGGKLSVAAAVAAAGLAGPRAFAPLDPFPAAGGAQPSKGKDLGGRAGALLGKGKELGSKATAATLGWHVHGAGVAPPTGISEDRLLRDLLHALQGVNSSSFRFDEAERHFVVDPALILSRPAWHLVQKIMELGNLHMTLLRASSASLEECDNSLLHQALGESLRDQLREYYKVLALLMAKLSDPAEGKAGPPELTLRRLWTWLQAPLERLRVLVSLSEACEPLRGGALASTVYGCSRVGDAVAQESCEKILRRVLMPLLSMMRVWMTEGELQDPFGEFFVCADASVPLEELWTRMYSMDVEMVPSFLSLDLARKILLTGKSINFIRLCCVGNEPLPPASEGPGSASLRRSGSSGHVLSSTPRREPRPLALPTDARTVEDISGLSNFEADLTGRKELPFADLSALVEQAALRTNKHLVSLMMDRYALGEHCLALRRFLLLGQGDFVESLLDMAQEDLSRNASDVYRHQLQGVLDMAVRQTNAQFCSPDVLARLGVKLMQPSPGEKAWDVFLLDYAINPPLHVVFTPVAMQKYDRAFAFLWRLRRVTHGLAGSWSQQMALQRHLVTCLPKLGTRAPELRMEMRQTLHKCACLRNEIHHLVQNIQSYIMCEVLETSWAKLQRGWQTSLDLDQVIAEHTRYLSCIEEGAFLAPRTEPVLSAISSLLGLALEFSDLHDQVCSSAFEAIEVLLAEPDGPMPYARSLAEGRAQIDQLGAGFLARLQSLTRALEAQPAGQLSSDLRFLICRLDFNGFYENKRPLR